MTADEIKKVKLYTIGTIKLQDEEPRLAFMDDLYYINFINSEDYYYFQSKGRFNISDKEAQIFVYQDNKVNRECMVEVGFNLTNTRSDFTFANLPEPKGRKDLYLLIVRYKYQGKYIVNYQIGYKGFDLYNPDDWKMYNIYNQTWEDIVYIYQRVNVLAWRSLTF